MWVYFKPETPDDVKPFKPEVCSDLNTKLKFVNPALNPLVKTLDISFDFGKMTCKFNDEEYKFSEKKLQNSI